jgi:hypothetical protein
MLGVSEFHRRFVAEATCAFVDVTESNDVAEVAGLADVALALAADADAGELDFLVWLVGRAGCLEGVRGEKVAKGGRASAKEEPPVNGSRHGEDLRNRGVGVRVECEIV